MGSLIVSSSTAFALPASIDLIENAFGGSSWYGYALSDHGAVVVGEADITGDTAFHAFRWTSEDGMMSIGNLGGNNSAALNVSGDGSVIVGWSDTESSGRRAFRWTQATGMIDIGAMGGSTKATGVSDDGSVVVGYGPTSSFRWTETTDMIDIGRLGGTSARAYNISADGNVIVGGSDTDSWDYHAFRWTLDDGMMDIDTFGGSFSCAYAASSDGSFIVGVAEIDGDQRAFRWTQTEGMRDLGTPDGYFSEALSVSGDGSVVVGFSNHFESYSSRAFRWTAETGMQNLNSLLSEADVDMTGIVLRSALDVSRGGEYILALPLSSNNNAYLVRYGEAVGITTYTAQKQATEKLADNQQAAQIQNRAIAGEMLGMSRPINTQNHAYSGGMFGSAAAYSGVQYSARGFTVLGGLSYGSQDFPNISQDGAISAAIAGRFVFNNLLDANNSFLRPYVEFGVWSTPNAAMTFRRTYANGSGNATGIGRTNTASWAGYGRGGLIWDINSLNQLVAYGELGQQLMTYKSYIEQMTPDNPFPATVDGGILRMNVARLGGAWTRKLDDILHPITEIPVTATIASSLGHSFLLKSNLKATVAGIGTTTGSSEDKTWGEFSGRIEALFFDNYSAGLQVNGTVGGSSVGNAVHGGFVLGYKF